jgi:hypothetical protein
MSGIVTSYIFNEMFTFLTVMQKALGDVEDNTFFCTFQPYATLIQYMLQ